jgi:hypothetical protein
MQKNWLKNNCVELVSGNEKIEEAASSVDRNSKKNTNE